ncbi:hypothetical protein AB0N65_02040 [Paenarthrobacter sp. NPDC089322]|uniref:hypothetical protein n=1 Tax=Paenarthrobacter sp. NPDC089322 TaxID=3155065 RepID=UPI003441F99D
MGAVPVQDKWAWAAGPVAVALGLVAHIVSGGSAPAISVLLAFAALSALAAQLVARWIHGPLLLLLVCGAAQQLLYFGFLAFGGSFPGVGFLDHLHRGGQGTVDADRVDAAPAETGAVGTPDVASTDTGAAHTGDLMLYTHTTAAILTLLIAYGLSKLSARGQRTAPSPAATRGNVP